MFWAAGADGESKKKSEKCNKMFWVDSQHWIYTRTYKDKIILYIIYYKDYTMYYFSLLLLYSQTFYILKQLCENQWHKHSHKIINSEI